MVLSKLEKDIKYVNLAKPDAELIKKNKGMFDNYGPQRYGLP